MEAKLLCNIYVIFSNDSIPVLKVSPRCRPNNTKLCRLNRTFQIPSAYFPAIMQKMTTISKNFIPEHYAYCSLFTQNKTWGWRIQERGSVVYPRIHRETGFELKFMNPDLGIRIHNHLHLLSQIHRIQIKSRSGVIWIYSFWRFSWVGSGSVNPGPVFVSHSAT